MLERRISLGPLAATLAVARCSHVVALTTSNVSDSQLLTDALVGVLCCVGVWALGAYVQTRRR